MGGAEQRIAELEAALAERDARIAERDARIAERDARIAELEKALAKLEREVERLSDRLGQNSSNSSRPPSGDKGQNPHRNAAKGKKRTGRKRGGQPGHRGVTRNLLPPEQVDQIHDLHPTTCSCCGGAVKPLNRAPRRHQVTELPKQLARTEEYRLHWGVCRNGHETQAALPEGVPQGAFGPRLVVAVGLLTGMYRLSKRNTRRLLEELFGARISEASISGCERRVSEALAKPHQRLHRHIKRVRMLHADETSWRESNEGCWLWVACTSMVAFFLVQTHRSADAAQRLLGAATARAAVLVTDRLGSYNWWIGPRQVCWAHVTRTLQSLADAAEGSLPHKYGTELLAHKTQMFDWWRRVRDGTLQHGTFRRYMKPVIEEFEALLDDAAVCGCSKTQGKARALLDDWNGLWTFVHQEGVPPTNNEAERDLRHAVIMRNLSYGTQSERGSRFIERILSTVETLRKQRRDVLPFLEQALAAHEHRAEPPSLLPKAA